MSPADINVESSSPWVVRLPSSSAQNLGAVRSVQGIQLLVDETYLWLRGDTMSAELMRRIRTIPDAEQFDISSGDQLVRPDTVVPCDRLPAGTWQSLTKWFQLELPRAGFAAAIRSKVNLTLVRASAPAVANVLETAWSVWISYATTAPTIRLSRLGFALADDGRVLVLGTPLPPIPGRLFVETNGIMIPNGWRLEPDVGPRVAAQVLGLKESEFALFREDGSFERISRASFVQATRSAVRATNGS